MRSKYLIVSLALILILVGIGSTVAYFNAQDAKDNVFTVGDVDIELKEESWDPEEDHVIRSNVSFDKDPTVSNIGSNDAYVRLSVKVSDYSILKDAMFDPEFSPRGLFGGYDASIWKLVEEPSVESDDSITYSYYYHEILEVGKKSEPLFTEIVFPDLQMHVIDTLENGLEISIWADAIQAEGFDTCEEAFASFDGQA